MQAQGEVRGTNSDHQHSSRRIEHTGGGEARTGGPLFSPFQTYLGGIGCGRYVWVVRERLTLRERVLSGWRLLSYLALLWLDLLFRIASRGSWFKSF